VAGADDNRSVLSEDANATANPPTNCIGKSWQTETNAANRRTTHSYAGPFFKLPGDTKRWMNGICYTFPVDARGRFR